METEFYIAIFQCYVVSKHVLKLNNFMFNNEHYIQVSGTAMGTKVAPSYFNIFTERLDQSAPNKPISWLHFITGA
jgi:hypothetical protein